MVPDAEPAEEVDLIYSRDRLRWGRISGVDATFREALGPTYFKMVGQPYRMSILPLSADFASSHVAPNSNICLPSAE